MYRPVRILQAMASAQIRSPDRILNRALELFSSRGYDATSVREICAAAGITKPTLYHFYGSKEGVFRSLVDGALENFRHRVVAEIESPGSPRERLQRIARGYFQYARENKELTQFLLSLVHKPPDSAPRTDLPRYYKEVVGLISRVVEEGVADGSFAPGPTDLRMLVLMGTLTEALHGYLIVGRPDITATLADKLVETVIQGWSKPY